MGNVADAPTSEQAVDRALSIIELLARNADLGVTEIAGSLGLHKSTAFRLLSVLEAHELVDQVGDHGGYRLGFGVVGLAAAVLARLDLVRESRDVCRAVADELRETVNIAVVDAGTAVNIVQDMDGSTVRVHNWIGKRTPLHATSSGKVLLAGSSVAEIEALVAARPDPQTLHAELDQVRRRGWAGSCGELEIGLNAVAAPIRGAGGAVVGAISISGPAYRLTEASFPTVARRLITAAGEISSRLGSR